MSAAAYQRKCPTMWRGSARLVIASVAMLRLVQMCVCVCACVHVRECVCECTTHSPKEIGGRLGKFGRLDAHARRVTIISDVLSHARTYQPGLATATAKQPRPRQLAGNKGLFRQRIRSARGAHMLTRTILSHD